MAITFETSFTGFKLGHMLMDRPVDGSRTINTMARIASPDQGAALAQEIVKLGSPHQTAQFLRGLADQIDATPSNDNQLSIPA